MELTFIESWTPSYAHDISKISLNERHFEVLLLARKFYDEYATPLAMRAFIPYTKAHLDPTFSSITMIELFGEENPLRTLSTLAGLPKPLGCL